MKFSRTLTIFLIGVMLLAAAPAFSKEYTMEDYLSMVEKNNKDLMLAASQLKTSDEQVKLARSQALPSIGLSSSLTRNFIDVEQMTAVSADKTTGNFNYADVDVNKDYDFSFGLGLSQEIFNLNVLNAIKASKEYKSMSKSVYEAQNDAIITAAKKVFFQCYLLEMLYNIKKETEKRAFEHYELMKKKYETGIVSKLAFLNAEVDWKMAVPETTNAKMNKEICLINLKNLAGIPQEEDVRISGDFTVYPDMPNQISFGEVLAERADYKALLGEKRLRELNIKANRANHYPTVSLDASYGYSASDNDIGKAFSENDRDVFSVGLTVSLPIFSGGALTAKDRQVKLEAEQTEIKLQQKREDIITDLRQIYLTLQKEFESIALAETTLTTAKQAYDIAETSFENGVMTQLELKDTRISLESAELNHISSVYNYLCAYFDWQNATGTM